MHEQDIRRAVGRPGGLDAAPAAAHVPRTSPGAWASWSASGSRPPAGTTVRARGHRPAAVRAAVVVGDDGRAGRRPRRRPTRPSRCGWTARRSSCSPAAGAAPADVDVAVEGDQRARRAGSWPRSPSPREPTGSAGRLDPADVPDLTGRRALVTGATERARRGARARAGPARRRGAAGGAQPGQARRDRASGIRRDVPGAVAATRSLVDLADLGSVRRAPAEAAAYGPLHLLVNNAGVMATPYQRTVDGFELQLATNVLRPVRADRAAAGRGWSPSPARPGSSTVSSQVHRMARRAPLTTRGSGAAATGAGRPTRRPSWPTCCFTFELDRRARASRPAGDRAGRPPRASPATGLMATGQPAAPRRSPRSWTPRLASSASRPRRGALPPLMAATADLPGSTYVGPGGPAEMRGAPRDRRRQPARTGPRRGPPVLGDRAGRNRSHLPLARAAGAAWDSGPVKALLLENLHPLASTILGEAGIEVETRPGALDEDELIEALDGVDLLGIRSKTEVTARVLDGPAGPGRDRRLLHRHQPDRPRRRHPRTASRPSTRRSPTPARSSSSRSPTSSRWPAG